MADHSWKRYWARRDGTINLSDGGYLADPEEKYGRVLNPHLDSLRALWDAPCLVLLGEPGIGKSTEVRQDCEEIMSSAAHQEARFVRQDLRACSSDERIVRSVFEGDSFRRWRNESSVLYMYLDSLDECRVHVANVAAVLIDQLRDVPHDRLRLRIACRTAEWPALLEEALQRWYKGKLRVLELAPLRRLDVEFAARDRGIDADAFLERVKASGAVPLAIKPITLAFLLSTFSESGSLPSTQAELYEKGCAILCQERNQSRIAARDFGNLSAGDRMNFASWIAASMTFSGKGVLRTDPTTEVATFDEIDLAELGIPGRATENALRETIAISGLFSGRGLGRLGWAHKTYTEFLAARFLVQQELHLEQILDLVLHHQDRKAVIPQLRETASWIASMRADVFDALSERDPQVLLASDVMKVDPKGRERLVENLLESFDREEAIDDLWDEPKHYGKLAHSALGAQLRPYIVSGAKNVVVRRAAIDIAEACKLRELTTDLLAVVLSASEEHHVRKQAAHAIACIGDDAVKLKLKPLLASDEKSDPQDELRGIALIALYPGLIAPAEMFASLSPPRDDSLFGAYASFFYARAENLASIELPHALTWALRTPPKDLLYSGPVNALQEAILEEAWRHARDPKITPQLAVLVARRLARHKSPFRRPEGEDGWVPGSEARRLVVRELLKDFEPRNAVSLLHGATAMLAQDDLSWLLDELESGATFPATLRLIRHLAWTERDAEVLSRVIEAAFAHQALKQELADMVEPVTLGTAKAEELKQTEEEWRRLSSTRPRRSNARLEVPNRIESLIHRCETEGIRWWWELTRLLSLDAEDQQSPQAFDCCITQFRGWVSASEEARARIVALAQRYVVEGDPENEAWFETRNSYRNSALAGYRALFLLQATRPGWLDNLDASTLKKWVPIIASYPSKPNAALTRLASERCHTDLLAVVMTRVDMEANDGQVEANRILDGCWSEAVATATLRKARETTFPAVANALIEQGIARGDRRFFELGLRMIEDPLPVDASEDLRGRRIDLWVILVRGRLRDLWPTLWAFMQRDRDLSRALWTTIAYRGYSQVSEVLGPLTPDQLADLYIWLVGEFPIESRRRSGWIGPGESVREFRDAVLSHLEHRGEEGCLAAMERVIAAFPSMYVMKMGKVRARRAVVRKTWRPVEPRDLDTLARDPRKRVIESEGQLQALVLESLERFQQTLHGELPAVRDLWDKGEVDAWKPVDEADLSDRIVRHFRDDLQKHGIVANREVKIRKGRPGMAGEQTDIFLDAVLSDAGSGAQRVSLVIEVKGCWNREVLNAMETQLSGRYLRDNACTHGLYLVGWFMDDGWSDKDSRRAAAVRHFPGTVQYARALFRSQAEALSRDGKTIASYVLDARLAKT